jgi:hypothetical protein
MLESNTHCKRTRPTFIICAPGHKVSLEINVIFSFVSLFCLLSLPILVIPLPLFSVSQLIFYINIESQYKNSVSTRQENLLRERGGLHSSERMVDSLIGYLFLFFVLVFFFFFFVFFLVFFFSPFSLFPLPLPLLLYFVP